MKQKRRRPAGAPPGTLTVPEGASVPQAIHIIHYTPDAVEEVDVASADDVAPFKSRKGITWVNVDGLGSAEVTAGLGQVFGLHPLALEDVLSLRQRPKLDDYETSLYLVLRMLHYEQGVETEQVSLFLGRDFVLTFQERAGDCLEPVRDRLRKGTGQLRRQGADYLMYAIIDAVIDNYFPFLEQIGEVVEGLEDDVVENPTRRIVGRIHNIKRDLLTVRRSVWPLREVVNAMARDESPLIGKTTRVYLRDCYDHAIHVMDIIETYRELAGGLMDVYLSSLSNKMNNVMKVLTVIATIFMPLTFVAGIYGMNFEHMPELHWRWGYLAVWIVIAVITLFMLWFFRRMGWLGGGKDQ
ncbi:MAG TPA: magnesium/cobalt transporter CorA [Planctomycetota bacterium]|nr:magnesium/cobalt transporter CorA [Planctomycetota bacterium]